MKYLLCLLFVSLCSCTDIKSQSGLNSIPYCSYYIGGLTQNENKEVGNYNGTVFFLRKRGKVYLVTAKHVLSGCKNYQAKDSLTPDFLSVNLNHKTIPSITIVFTQKIKDTAACVSPELSLDIITVQIQDTAANKVSSLEKLIKEKISPSDSLEIIGFPSYNIINRVLKGEITTFKMKINANSILSGKQIPIKEIKDDFNYWVEDNTNIDIAYMPGFSGSPVYIKNKKGKRKLIGVFIGSRRYLDKTYWLVTKIKYVKAHIKTHTIK